MFWEKTRKWLIFAALGAAMTSSVPLWGQTGGLQGDCRDEKGEPFVKYTVQIDRKDVKGNYHTKTDKKGHYVYIGLPIGPYKVTLLDPNGRQIFNYNGVHIGLGDPTEQDFDMAKEKAQQAKEAQTNPEAQKALQQQKAEVEEQKQFTGLKQLFEQGTTLYAQAQAMQPSPSDPIEKRNQVEQDRQAKYVEAAAAFEKAVPLAKDRNLVAVESQLASSYAGAHQYDKAAETYQKVIALNPADPAVHNSLGSVYAQMNKIPEAQAEFQKSAELNPAGAAMAYYNLGAIMTNAGKLDEAAAAFKKATDIDPKYADAYFLEAQALMGKATMGADGKVVPAPGTVECLQQYLKLDPNGKYAGSAQAMLQSITGSVQTEYKVEKKKKK